MDVPAKLQVFTTKSQKLMFLTRTRLFWGSNMSHFRQSDQVQQCLHRSHHIFLANNFCTLPKRCLSLATVGPCDRGPLVRPRAPGPRLGPRVRPRAQGPGSGPGPRAPGPAPPGPGLRAWTKRTASSDSKMIHGVGPRPGPHMIGNRGFL